MRTLICEFQPFFESIQTKVVSYGELYELDGHIVRQVSNGRSKRYGTPNKHYHYAYVGNKPVKRGDWALVHNGSEFGIIEIKRVIPGIEPCVTKHVIEVLTQDEFKAYLERNKKIDELRNDMDELEFRLKKHKQLEKYEALAEEDPRAKELLGRIKEELGMSAQPTLEVAPTENANA